MTRNNINKFTSLLALAAAFYNDMPPFMSNNVIGELDKEDVLKRLKKRQNKPKPLKKGMNVFYFDAYKVQCAESDAVYIIEALNLKMR